MIVGLFVVFGLLSITNGCVVTSGGHKAGCAKCGRNCQENHYTPTRVTVPTVPAMSDEVPAEPVRGPILETPQTSTDAKEWRSIVKTPVSSPIRQPKTEPIQTARKTTSQQCPTSTPNLFSTLFPPLHSSPTSLQQKQLRQQQARQVQQAQVAQQQSQRMQQLRLQSELERRRQAVQVAKNDHTPWYDPLGMFGQPALSAAKPVVVQQPRPVPQPVQQPRIAQVSHETPSPQTVPLTEPKRLPSVQTASRVSMNSQASPELHKPWNMDEFRPRYASSGNPYRLVSETQTATKDRTAPPTVDITRFTNTSARTPTTTQARAQNTEPSSQGLPIFGVGRELMKEFRPSNDRKWSQNHAVLQTASFNGNFATVHNVRYSKYENGEVASIRYYDATFNLNDIRTIDLVIVPFRGAPRLAHVQASFGFADGRHIGMSIEARYEEGEKYDALGSTMRQFELIYVLADERDLLRYGSDVNKNDVHVYRLKFEPAEVREMFVDALNRANALAVKPEFYHPLRNSCVTNLIGHINKGRPKAIPKEYRTLLPGLLDNYAYDLKLVDTTAKTFKEAKENAKVNWLVEKYGDLEYFSAGIRQNMY